MRHKGRASGTKEELRWTGGQNPIERQIAPLVQPAFRRAGRVPALPGTFVPSDWKAAVQGKGERRDFAAGGSGYSTMSLCEFSDGKCSILDLSRLPDLLLNSRPLLLRDATLLVNELRVEISA